MYAEELWINWSAKATYRRIRKGKCFFPVFFEVWCLVICSHKEIITLTSQLKSLAFLCPTAKCSYGWEEIAVWVYVVKYCIKTKPRWEREPSFQTQWSCVLSNLNMKYHQICLQDAWQLFCKTLDLSSHENIFSASIIRLYCFFKLRSARGEAKMNRILYGVINDPEENSCTFGWSDKCEFV